MKNKKMITLIIIAICVVFLLLSVISIAKRNSTSDENAVTRFQWLEMLGEQFGINEYNNTSPYFKDVDADSPFFQYVQSAVEWEIIEDTTKFRGDKPADGEFIALTTMKAIGKYKVQIYLETDKEPEIEDYLEVAFENGLIKRKQLNDYFTEEECAEILIKAQELNDLLLWKDDLAEVVYQENVKQIEKENVITYIAQENEIKLNTSTTEGLSVGDIIIFEIDNTGVKTAGKIESIDKEGEIIFSKPKMEEVFASLLISDVTRFTEQDIINYYQLNQAQTIEPMGLTMDSDYKMMPMRNDGFLFENKGLEFSVFTEDRNMYVSVKDNNTNKTTKYLVEKGIEENIEVACTFGLNDIEVGAQLKWSWNKGLEYANLMSYAELKCKTSLVLSSKDIEIPLFTLPIPVAAGLGTVEVQCNLVISSEGKISLEASVPVGFNLVYEDGQGIRNVKQNYLYKEPNISVEAEMKFLINPKVKFVILKLWDAAEVGVKAGAGGKAETTFRDSMDCTDITVAFPILSLEASIDPLIWNEISEEWEIFDFENAKHKKNLHVEVYKNGEARLVDKCTYIGVTNISGKKDKDREKEIKKNVAHFSVYEKYELPITLNISDIPVDIGDYYVVKGNISIPYCIFCHEFNDLNEGDEFEILKKTFVKGKSIEAEGFWEPIYEVYCVDDNATYYVCTDMQEDFGIRFDGYYYSLLQEIPLSDALYETSISLVKEIEEVELLIDKDGFIISQEEYEFITAAREYDPTITEEELFIENEEERMDAFKGSGFTISDCVENKEVLGGWWIFGNNTSIYGDSEFSPTYWITFDKDGIINSLIMQNIG